MAKRPNRSSSTATNSSQDGAGYLLSGRHSTIYLFDVATKKLDRLTTAKNYDESSPSWSPDGARIAFMSNHAADPDRDPEGQLYVADAQPGSTEKALSPLDMPAGRGKPEWSPDGKWIAFLVGEEKKYGAYGMERLAVVASDGSGKPTLVKAAADLDRGVSAPAFHRRWPRHRRDRGGRPLCLSGAYSAFSGGAAEKLMQPPDRGERAARSARLLGRHRRRATRGPTKSYAFENGVAAPVDASERRTVRANSIFRPPKT